MVNYIHSWPGGPNLITNSYKFIPGQLDTLNIIYSSYNYFISLYNIIYSSYNYLISLYKFLYKYFININIPKINIYILLTN